MTIKKSYETVWVFYDFLLSHGGAERTTVLLQEVFDGLICTAYIEEDGLLPYDKAKTRCISRKQNIPGLPTLDGLWSFFTKTKFLRLHDGPVIFSGSNAVVAAHNHDLGKNILYCHTIPRFAYDMRMYYRKPLPMWKRFLFDALCIVSRVTYRSALAKMDTIIVNSRNVQKRLRQYTGYESQVVYPPVATKKFSYQSTGDYYLSTARLEEFKRVDLIIRAFLKMPGKKLVVASSGCDEGALRELAGDAENIHFTGWIDEAELKNLIENCIASIYMPIDEDFGLSPVESMAAGKPVIGAKEGGLLETVLHQQTGCLCCAAVKELTSAVEWLTPERAKAMRADCEARAAVFDEEIFIETMKEVVESS